MVRPARCDARATCSLSLFWMSYMNAVVSAVSVGTRWQPENFDGAIGR